MPHVPNPSPTASSSPSDQPVSTALPLILGGCFLAVVLLAAAIIIALIMVHMKRKKSTKSTVAATNPTTAREEPVYASVLLPPLHREEGIELKENDAYGILHSDAPRYETIGPRLLPNS